jgi:hypothetical protein
VDLEILPKILYLLINICLLTINNYLEGGSTNFLCCALFFHYLPRSQRVENPGKIFIPSSEGAK